MYNYCRENNIDVRYSLWGKGYRFANANVFGEKDFVDLLNERNINTNWDEDSEVTFDELFEELLESNPEYFIGEVAEQEAYTRKNEPKLIAYWEKYFKGKTWEEVENDATLYSRFDFYSDWHKDVYGFRPRSLMHP